MIATNLAIQKTKNPELFVVIGGDVNRRNIRNAVRDFPEIKKLRTGPTRGRQTLDVVYTDLPNCNVDLLNPLDTDLGTPSDHKTIFVTAKPKKKEEKKRTYYYETQPITTN